MYLLAKKIFVAIDTVLSYEKVSIGRQRNSKIILRY